MTSNMVDKLTSLVKKPGTAEKNSQFDTPVIAKNAATDLKKIEELQQLKAEWAHALNLEEEEKSEDLKSKIPLDTQKEIQTFKAQPASLAQKTIGEISNKTPLQAVIRRAQVVETEMTPLPTVPETKGYIPLKPLNALKATLITQKNIKENGAQSRKNSKTPSTHQDQPNRISDSFIPYRSEPIKLKPTLKNL